MTSHPEIRRAIPGDLEALAAIEHRCFADDAFNRRQLAYLITQAKGACFVAFCNGVVVGYISLLERAHLHNLRIYSVAVDSTAQGKGLGQLLLDRCMTYAQARGLHEITLEVRTDNTAAIGLYTKNGFVGINTLHGYYHDGADAWRMKLRLRA